MLAPKKWHYVCRPRTFCIQTTPCRILSRVPGKYITAKIVRNKSVPPTLRRDFAPAAAPESQDVRSCAILLHGSRFFFLLANPDAKWCSQIASQIWLSYLFITRIASKFFGGNSSAPILPYSNCFSRQSI
jgi:hypothetical protein